MSDTVSAVDVAMSANMLLAEKDAYIAGVEQTSENRGQALITWEAKANEYLKRTVAAEAESEGLRERIAELERGSGVGLIAAERRRQTEVEGWTPEHDEEHEFGQLSLAAVCYVELAADQESDSFIESDPTSAPNHWPFESSWWKPSEDTIRNLVKAGALIAAEIDRLQRYKEATHA